MLITFFSGIDITLKVRKTLDKSSSLCHNMLIQYDFNSTHVSRIEHLLVVNSCHKILRFDEQIYNFTINVVLYITVCYAMLCVLLYK